MLDTNLHAINRLHVHLPKTYTPKLAYPYFGGWTMKACYRGIDGGGRIKVGGGGWRSGQGGL